MPEKIVIHWDLHKKKHTVYLSEYVKSNSDSFGSKDIPASLIINLT